MLKRIKSVIANWLGNDSERRPVVKIIRAGYDASMASDSAKKHWQYADLLSAKSANSTIVRQTLRTRARYEVFNNSYLRGMIETLANDTIGTGPRLQLLGEDRESNSIIEDKFERHCNAICLAEKLRTKRKAKVQDGESLSILITNPGVLSEVKLDLRIIEADQFATPFFAMNLKQQVDGILLDSYGNPIEYHVLKAHPGDIYFTNEKDSYQPHQVIHYFRVDRPGQYRGIPEITAALPLFAMQRDFTLATLDAAKAAAYAAGVIHSTGKPSEDDEEIDPNDVVELERNTWMTLPRGYDISQLKAEHPNATYKEFKNELLNECARCLNMPFNIAAGNSASYNYASGRMDHQIYYKAIRVERRHIEVSILDRVFSEWLNEARLIPGYLPAPAKSETFDSSHNWHWDGNEHVDPSKEASAQAQRLSSLSTSLSAEYAKLGKDWERELEQIAKERNKMRELKIDFMQLVPTVEPISDEGEGDSKETPEESNED